MEQSEAAAEPAVIDESGLTAEVARLAAELSTRSAEHQDALNRLRLALIDAAPGINAEAVTGGSVSELEESFAAARERLTAARDEARRELAARVPPASEGRGGAEPVTALEKIRRGLDVSAAR